MNNVPAWWRSDAPHWRGRTTTLTAIVTFFTGTVLTINSTIRTPGAPATSYAVPPLQAVPETPGVTPSGLCSADSESRVGDGWGPGRPTYHDDTFPPSLTFNSTSDNFNIGDERNFVTVKPAADTQPSGWLDSVEAHNDDEYLVRVYVRLDGPDTHSASGTNLMVNVPTCTGHRIGLAAILSSTDAFPGEVWDGASLWSRSDFNLALVPDSGTVYGNAYPSGLAFSVNDLVTSKGIPLGSGALDGVFEPGYEHSVYVTFKVRAQVAE